MAVILVVDDEPVVLRSVAGALHHAGFSVLSAPSPREALHIGATHSGAIDLMICDVLMPDLTGPRLAEQFLRLHPETKLLFMAGLPDHPEVREFIIAPCHAFLAKPFLPRDLVAKVNSLLNTPPPLALTAGM